MQNMEMFRVNVNLSVCLALIACWQSQSHGDTLPAASDRPAIEVPHFPDRAHAVVWRNWQLVQPARIAKVLGTDVEQVTTLAMCTSNPRVQKWLGDSLAYLFREVPGLGGVFTITASENLTNCACHGAHANCPRCKHRTDTEIIAEVNTVIAEGVHRGNPNARVLVWDWGWKGHGDAPDIIERLPDSVWLMSVSEWAKQIQRGGVKTQVGEYSIFHVVFTAPVQMGPANLLYPQPTGFAATMVGIPSDDLKGWRGPYPAEVFADQFEKVATGGVAGLVELEKAAEKTPAPLRQGADSELRVARAAQLHFASVANQARFVMARDALLSGQLPAAQQQQTHRRMAALLDQEIGLAGELYRIAQRDARIGYEAANHYFYVPLDLVEKVINCEHIRATL